MDETQTRREGRAIDAELVDAFSLNLEDIFSNFRDPKQEWRRLIAEFVGTFFLVLVAAGAAMVAKAYPDTVTEAAAVVAPGIMVMAIIMFMGKISGAHLNPGVSIAFALRGDFPWNRVPGYVVVQLAGAIVAALLLEALVGLTAADGGTFPGKDTSDLAAFGTEAVLTFGLVSVILGTASGAQNIGIVGAIGVGGYIALAGLWAAPLSGASMNFARSFGPGLIGSDLTAIWVYLAGPLTGAVAAVLLAFILRGRGGGRAGSRAAQGTIHTEVSDPAAPVPGTPPKPKKGKKGKGKKRPPG
ncbi:MAG: MIP/aquaporin family protein [Solirubrobacterales bacterium]